MRVLGVLIPLVLLAVLELPLLWGLGGLRGRTLLSAWGRVIAAKLAPLMLWIAEGFFFPNSPAMSWVVGVTVIGGFAFYFAACYGLLCAILPEPSCFRVCIVLVFVVPLVWIPLVRIVGLKLLHPITLVS